MDPNSQTQQQSPQPSFSGLHKCRKTITIVVVSVMTVIGIFFLLTVAAPALFFVSFIGSCNERGNELQRAVTSLEGELKAISINGISPDQVTARKDGDCLTGHGAVGDATFSYSSYPNVNLANQALLKGLNSPTSPSDTIFKLGGTDEEYRVTYIHTRMQNGSDKKTYKVKYYLTTPVSCPDIEDEDSTVCVLNEPLGGVHRYANIPIYKVELEGRKLAD